MGLRIGGGFGLGPVGVGAGFRVGGGRRSRSGGDDGGWAAILLGLVAIVLAIFATIVLGFLIVCFSIGLLIAHLAGSGGLKSGNRRPWVTRALLCIGAFTMAYLINRGGLGSAWSNFDFGADTKYEAGRRYEGSMSDDWRLLFELGLWSFALGLILSAPAHWMVCANHHPHRSQQKRSVGEYIKEYWFAYSTLLSLPGLGLLIWILADERMLEAPGGVIAFIIFYGVISGCFLLLCACILLLAGVSILFEKFINSFSAKAKDLDASPTSQTRLRSPEIDTSSAFASRRPRKAGLVTRLRRGLAGMLNRSADNLQARARKNRNS